jgi:hypothetical protein
MRKARIKVLGRIDCASSAMVTIDRSGLISVRPYRRHREYTLPLEAVARAIVYQVVMAELKEKKRAKRKVKRF